MNFDFSEDQRAIQEQVRSTLAKCCDLTKPRAITDAGNGYDHAIWQQIVDLGWTATAIPEEFGGLGLSHLELCLIAEEMGRALTPVPFIASVYLASELIQMAASASQKQAWLPDIARGDIYTVSLSDSDHSLVLENDRLSGSVDNVLHGAEAHFAIVSARRHDGSATLVRVPLQQSVIARSPLDSIDPTLPLSRLVFSDADAEPLGAQIDVDLLRSQLYDRTAVLLAFEQVGGCEAVIEMAKAYTCDRYAFGRQVGSFQAIKHKLADMFVAKELAKSNAYYGAWALANASPELALAAATARVSATDAYWLCSKENIQAHGGMGFTWEFDCHLYYRRAQALSRLLGSGAQWKQLLAQRLLAA